MLQKQDGSVLLEITDDGDGFQTVPAIANGFGLQGNERSRQTTRRNVRNSIQLTVERPSACECRKSRMNKPIRILICDDQVVVCERIQSHPDTVRDVESWVWHTMVKEAIEMIEQVHPDLILMDLKNAADERYPGNRFASRGLPRCSCAGTHDLR